MYSRILVPLDGSTFAAQALPYAKLAARALNADIELFCVVPDLAEMMRTLQTRYDNGGMEDTTPGPTLEQWREAHLRVREAAEQSLEEWAESLRPAGLSVRTKVGEGSPAVAIAREAERSEGTLIVMTTHGRSGISRWSMGSVADKTIRVTTTPALVVRCREEEADTVPGDLSVRQIILPLDGSRFAEQAIPHAMALAKALEARVDVLMAVSGPAYEPIRYPVPEAYPSGLNARAGEYAVGIVDKLRTAGIESEASTVEQDAAGAIADAAAATADSLVVMSTHGRSGLGRWMLGSVADKVVRHSQRPVLLVRAKEQTAAERAA